MGKFALLLYPLSFFNPGLMMRANLWNPLVSCWASFSLALISLNKTNVIPFQKKLQKLATADRQGLLESAGDGARRLFRAHIRGVHPVNKGANDFLMELPYTMSKYFVAVCPQL